MNAQINPSPGALQARGPAASSLLPTHLSLGGGDKSGTGSDGVGRSLCSEPSDHRALSRLSIQEIARKENRGFLHLVSVC